ncbi:MAG: MTH938/NDUFAF3 family protein [Candidatus Aenigmatarchaeota archaeon]
MKPKIERVDFGNIVIDGKNYGSKDLVVYWDKIEEREKSHFFSEKEFKKILLREPKIVIISTGFYDCVRIEKGINVIARVNKVDLLIMRTKEACEKFNSLDDKVVLVLHSTC